MKGTVVDARSVRTAWWVALGALAAGALYYACVRAAHPPRAAAWLFEALSWRGTLADPTAGTLPSFLHGLALTAAAVAVGGRRVRVPLACAAALAVPLALEWRLGTPDPRDAFALVAGTAFALLVLRPRRVRDPVDRRADDRSAMDRAGRTLGPVALVLASAALTVGSEYTQQPGCARYDTAGYCAERKRFATPIYLDKASLRNAVRVEVARPLDRIGQLHAIGSWLFVGETNRGVHVIDNTDPAAPVNVGFLRIPGNTEVAVRGTTLYADSYVDLVTLDVSNPANVRVVDRREDVFPFDAFQNVPYDIAFRYENVNESRGVVVGYEE